MVYEVLQGLALLSSYPDDRFNIPAESSKVYVCVVSPDDSATPQPLQAF
jgi:hypothetical protein